MASVAAVKAGIDAAIQHVREGRDAARTATLGAVERAEQYAAAV